MRQKVEYLREEVQKSKKWERELEFWEEQRKVKPGLATEHAAMDRLAKLYEELWPEPALAPLPREVKKPAKLP
jgi:hypothetical protein